MPSSPTNPLDLSPDDMMDRTLELDVRWLQYDKPEAPAKARQTTNHPDDPTVVLDLTATQVHELLKRDK